MKYSHDTYGRRIQLGASRRRWENAQILYDAGNWAGAMYMAGYAIECALCAAICYADDKTNFKDTKAFRAIQGAKVHNLASLLLHHASLRQALSDDGDRIYQDAWNIVTSLWLKDSLRYWDKVGNKKDCERFIQAVKLVYAFILHAQREAL